MVRWFGGYFLGPLCHNNKIHLALYRGSAFVCFELHCYDDHSVVALQMGHARTATHPVSRALERGRTSVQNVLKVCQWFSVFARFSDLQPQFDIFLAVPCDM